MQWGVAAMWSYVAVMWCGVATWVNDQQITDNNAEIQKINNNRTQLSKRDRTQQEQKKRGQNHKLLSVFAPESPALKWFASDWRRGVLRRWRGGQVSKDLLLCTLFVPFANGPLAQSNHKIQQFYQAKFKVLSSNRFLSFFFFFVYLSNLPSSFHLTKVTPVQF